MSRRFRLAALALLTVLLAFPSARAGAAGSVSALCGGRTLCDRQLGVSLTLPARWVRLPRVPRYELDLAVPGAGPGGYIRLVIRAFGRSSIADKRAASLAADDLIAEFPRLGGRVSRTPVSYGGGAGVALRGLPPSQPGLDIVLAAHRAVYLLILPGAHLSTDQRQALGSLRFIDRSGLLPVPSVLTVQPNPARRGQRLQIRLDGALPDAVYRFTATPNRPGFGGGYLARGRADGVGVVRLTSTPPTGAGQWTLNAYGPGGHRVATAVLGVQAASG